MRIARKTRAFLASVSIATICAAGGHAVAADAPALAPAPPAPPAAPAALPGVNAVLTMWGAGGWLYSEDYDFANCCDYGRSYFAGGAEAAFTGRNWQFDFVAATHGDTSSSDDDNPTYFGLGGHFLMPSDGRVLGGFAAVTATSMHDTDDWALHLIGGVEAAMTMGNTRMFAQLGALVAIAGDTTETWERGIFGVVGVQHFLSASTMASADVMLGHGRFDESTTSGWTAAWTVALEHRLSGPFSAGIFYSGHIVMDSSNCCAPPADERAISHTVGVTLSVDLGGPMQNRPIFSLPDFFRAFAWPDAL
jgi:hypothetical protein